MLIGHDFLRVVIVNDYLIGVFNFYDCERAGESWLEFGRVGQCSHHDLLTDFVEGLVIRARPVR